MTDPSHPRHRSELPPQGPPPSPQESFARRALITAGIVALMVALGIIVVQAIDVLLLAFAGLLLAIILRSLSEPLSKYTHMRSGMSLMVVCTAIVGVIILASWLMAGQVVRQVDRLSREIPRAVQEFRQQLEQYEWGQTLMTQAERMDAVAGEQLEQLLLRATGVLTTTFGVIVAILIVLFVGLYVAYDPGLYKEGIVRLFPVPKRPRVRVVMTAMWRTLQWWLIGRLVSMVLVGVMTGVGLWLLDVDLAILLGILAGVLDFIPNIGPIVAMIPALLLALTDGFDRFLYVLILYTVVQQIESYLITPIIQMKAVHLPPALTILTQIMLAVMLGIPGLILATPLTAAALILVQMVYVEDTLGDQMDLEAEEKALQRFGGAREQQKAPEPG